MHILMVDDDEFGMSDYCAALKNSGHSVLIAKNLNGALKILCAHFEGREHIDVVIIDLQIETDSFPKIRIKDKDVSLSEYYLKIELKENNEGQALGQWLWEMGKSGMNNIARPAYFYLTALTQNYKSNKLLEQQEFKFLENTVTRNDFILNKAKTLPSDLVKFTNEISSKWNLINQGN